jgi:hypothetical protein
VHSETLSLTAEFRNCEAMLCAFRNFITDRTSQSAGAGIRASIFNSCTGRSISTNKQYKILIITTIPIPSPNRKNGRKRSKQEEGEQELQSPHYILLVA